MKKIICFILCICFVLCLAACGGENEEIIEGTAGKIKDTIDLSKMSSTVVYSELTNILNAPDKNLGKIIKMSGTFAVNKTETGTYFLCMVNDSTACCQQGMEFTLKGNPEYPNGYPEDGAQITVKGEFTTYDENGSRYCKLNDAEIF